MNRKLVRDLGRDLDNVWLAGIDGCPHGWLVAFVRPSGNDVRVQVVSRFSDIFAAAEAPSIVAVDMPIGLPERDEIGLPMAI